MMSKMFKYDVVLMIRSIEKRPCLWNKTVEAYKDRIERRSAWQEVFRTLEPEYDEMPSKQQKAIEEKIMNKWTNVRDAFYKSLKVTNGKPKRKYLYYNELQFLLRFVPEHSQNSEEAGYSSAECTDDSAIFNMDPIKLEPSITTTSPVNYGTVKRPKTIDLNFKKSNDCMSFVEVDEGTDPRIMNEDEAFFASLLPSVVKYTEDERLEFRIEVLALMRRIKDQRN